MTTPIPVPPARPAATARRSTTVAAAVAALVFGTLAAGLVGIVAAGTTGGVPGAGESTVREAPPLDLTDQDGRPFSLASLRGHPALVFFGYTDCPDVCPINTGVVNQALEAAGDGTRAVFVSIDPRRDDVAAMKAYLRYLPMAYTMLTGTPDQLRQAAEAWRVSYAKVEQASPGDYTMAHTGDIFLVDADGRLRDRFPFGTAATDIAAALRDAGPTAGEAAAIANAPPAPSVVPAPPAGGLVMAGGAMDGLISTVVSTSIWAGGPSPVILTITDGMGMPLDGTLPVRVRVVGADGRSVGDDVPAVAIRPDGEQQVSYLATVSIPTPGSWRLDLVGGDGRTGSVMVDALDQGLSVPLGAPAPALDTPTLAGAGGNLLAVSTLPQADPRLYSVSMADATAARRPYVLVVDSARFKVSPACGRALTMIRFLLDRWPDVAFIHLEPFRYGIVTGEPELEGDIANPPLNDDARALGLGDATWPATKMPWIFVVDGNGIVRAKATGVVGSADVDLVLSLITGDGVLGG